MKQNFFATLDTSRNVMIEYMQKGGIKDEPQR